MTPPTAVEQERLNHINNLMTCLHDCNNNIYEGLVDREFAIVKESIECQIERLMEIKNSIEDEL